MGRPKGSLNDRLWRDAVRKAALEIDPESKKRYIELAARATVLAASKGDQAAAREMGDRLDGKAHQTHDIVQEHHHYVVEIPATPKETNDQWSQRYGHA